MSEEFVDRLANLDPVRAKGIVNTLGGAGTPPEYGIEYYTVGIEPYIKTLKEEYLQGLFKIDYSAFKLVLGSYGGGKTHFLYAVRDLAFRERCAVSYVPLSPAECPFDKLELVYAAVANNLCAPPASPSLPRGWQERGIESFIRAWHAEAAAAWEGKENSGDLREEYLEAVTGIESVSFRNAVKTAFRCLAKADEENFSKILLWLKAEGFDRDALREFGVLEEVGRLTAFRMLRSLIQWVKIVGCSGMVLLFDEAERGMSVVRAREKKIALDNLRQIIDECGNGRLPSCLILYAVPDENPLLDGQLGVYEALRQRLKGVFSKANPSGVRVNLEQLGLDPVEFLTMLGDRLSAIYDVAYSFRPEGLRPLIDDVAKAAYSFRYHNVGHRRLFVKTLVQSLHLLRDDPSKKLSYGDVEMMLKQQLAEEAVKEEKRSDEVEF